MTFGPRCRYNWHIHRATKSVKHWHDTATDSWFVHLAFEIPCENTSNEWLEPVTDEEYGKLQGYVAI